MLVRAGLAKIRGAKPSHSRGYIWRRRVVLALAATGLVAMAYGRFIEPRWLEVTRVRVESARLSGASRPVRIVHISDIHCEPCAGLEETLPETIAGLSPDVIVFTGDAINHREAAGRFRRFMTRLAGIAPTLAVRGNWEVDYFPNADIYGGTGVEVLSGRAVKLTLAGADVWLAGVDAHSEDRIGAALDAAPPGACKILLSHFPDPILEVASRGDVDLQLSGHIHGGQVALPFYGAIITISRHGKRFERGLYEVGPTHLYVSRGVGTDGGAAPRVRFFSRPEVTLVELSPSK
jgi:predicted MPP superfamily phosphohydrolase